MNTQEQEIQIAGLTGEIAAIAHGDTNGQPVLSLHGWLDNATTFRSVYSALPQCRWISLDLPGHGLSEHRPAGCIYHFTDYVADVYCVIKQAGLENLTVVGHSLGAGIAAMFTAAFPQLVKRLVLVDGLGPISGEDDNTLGQFKKSMIHLENRNDQKLSEYRSWEELVEKRMRAGQIERHSVETLLGRGTFRRDEKIVVRSDPRLKQHSPIYMSQAKVLSILSGISTPTLLVLAKDGLVISRKSTEQRISAIPNIEVKTVDGHHHVHMDFPERVIPLIAEFIDQ